MLTIQVRDRTHSRWYEDGWIWSVGTIWHRCHWCRNRTLLVLRWLLVQVKDIPSGLGCYSYLQNIRPLATTLHIGFLFMLWSKPNKLDNEICHCHGQAQRSAGRTPCIHRVALSQPQYSAKCCLLQLNGNISTMFNPLFSTLSSRESFMPTVDLSTR